MIHTSAALAKRTLPLLLSAVLLSPVPLCAQTETPPPSPPAGQAGPSHAYGGPRRGGPDQRAEILQRQLDLTPEQTVQVKALMEAEHGKMEAIHANSTFSAEDMHTQMAALHAESDGKLRALLTPDQLTKLDALLARMRQVHATGQTPPSQP